MAKKTVVEFVKGNAPYVKGDVAGFDPKVAAKLVEKGVAVEYTGKTAVAPKTETKDEKPKDTKDSKDSKDSK